MRSVLVFLVQHISTHSTDVLNVLCKQPVNYNSENNITTKLTLTIIYTWVLKSALPIAPVLTLENCILPPSSDTLK